MQRVRIAALVTIASMLWVSVASAALYNPRKVKKWPEMDKVWIRSFDAFMSDEELDIFQGLRTTEERKSFLKEAGYWKMWEEIDEDEMLEHVIAGEVVPGMSKDEVIYCWDKPAKIRKDFKRDAYVDVLNFEFEIDRKGNEFLLRPDSQTAYKNEIRTKFVYMYNGSVFSIVWEGEEEEVLDDLPVEDSPEPTPAPEPEPEPSEGDEAATEPETE